MSKKNTKAKTQNQMKFEQVNSLQGVVTGLTGFGSFGTSQGVPVNQQGTLQANTSYELLFWNRTLLSQLYIKHGIIQTLINQPVDDAFSKGIDIKSQQISTDQINELQEHCEGFNILETVGQAIKWGRLFGGGALVVLTEQKQDEPLDISKIDKDSEVIFYPADLWELNGNVNIDDVQTKLQSGPQEDNPYMFYGKRVHPSRVLTMKGREAPSIFRHRFRGWGMSEVERMMRSLNQFFKNQDVLFELMDEAKVDIYKVAKLNSGLMTNEGSAQIQKRLQMMNMLKNFQNAIVMDKEDDHEQKQINLTGLADVLKTIREGVAADLRMPVTKLFGISSAGFNSGEDDIENYNSMIESEVRSKSKWIIIKVLQIICQQKFGFVPDDLRIEFPSLRVLSSEGEQQVKTSEFQRIIMAYQNGLIDTKQAQSLMNKNSILPDEVEETDDPFEFQGEQTQGLLDGQET